MRGICLTCPFIAILTVKVIKSVKSFLSQFGLEGSSNRFRQLYGGPATGIYFTEQLTQKSLTLCRPADEAGACETADSSLRCRRPPSLLCSLKGGRTITEVILQKNKQTQLLTQLRVKRHARLRILACKSEIKYFAFMRKTHSAGHCTCL